MSHADAHPPVTAGAPNVSSSAYVQTELSWVRSRLSAERTFLSWTRTATTLVGFGFTLYQLLPVLANREVTPDDSRAWALALIAAGLVVQVIGIAQWRNEAAFAGQFEIDGIGHEPGLPSWRFSWLFAAFVIITGLASMAWIAAN
ncbi:MAG: YidH family protein [Chloroflexota bacterium]